MSPLTEGDRRLAGRAGRGDDAAFASLTARHRDRLVRGARRRLGDRRDDAEDVVQDALLNALRALRAGKRPDNPSAWLTAIVANGCADHHRAVARRPAAPLLEDADAGPAGADSDPHVVALGRERVAGAVRAVQALPETQREALVGFELSGRTYEELAEQHGWTVPGTKSLLWRARTTLAAERDRWAAAFATPLVVLGQLARSLADRPAALLGAQHGSDAATYAVVAVVAAGAAGGVAGGVDRPERPRDVDRAAADVRALPAPAAQRSQVAGRPAASAAAAPAAGKRGTRGPAAGAPASEPRAGTVAPPAGRPASGSEAARLATAEQVLRACANGRPLDRARPAALRAARDEAPADLAQYTDCPADIRRALAGG